MPDLDSSVNWSLQDSSLSLSDSGVAIVYDRRGMTFEHIDAGLHHACSELTRQIKYWYGDCINKVYVVHINSFFWATYYLLKPFLDCLIGDKVIILNEAKDIRQYIDEDQLPPGFLAYRQDNPNESSSAINSTVIESSINKESVDDNKTITVPPPRATEEAVFVKVGAVSLNTNCNEDDINRDSGS